MTGRFRGGVWCRSFIQIHRNWQILIYVRFSTNLNLIAPKMTQKKLKCGLFLTQILCIASEDLQTSRINYCNGWLLLRLIHIYSVCSAFALRIFSHTHFNGSERSHWMWFQAAAVQQSFPHTIYFCCAACGDLKWQRFVHGKNEHGLTWKCSNFTINIYN